MAETKPNPTLVAAMEAVKAALPVQNYVGADGTMTFQNVGVIDLKDGTTVKIKVIRAKK